MCRGLQGRGQLPKLYLTPPFTCHLISGAGQGVIMLSSFCEISLSLPLLSLVLSYLRVLNIYSHETRYHLFVIDAMGCVCNGMCGYDALGLFLAIPAHYDPCCRSALLYRVKRRHGTFRSSQNWQSRNCNRPCEKQRPCLRWKLSWHKGQQHLPR